MDRPAPPDLDLHRLPAVVRELVELIGVDEALALLRARGGAPLYIAQDPQAAGVLRESLSPTAVAALCRAWGGDTLRLPKADRLLAQARDRAIRAARGTSSKREIAAAYNLTTERVRQIWRSGGGNDSATLELFADE